MEKDKENVVVTTVTGAKYTKMYNRLFWDSQIRYANRLNKNFVFITDTIEHSPRHQHVSWQKMLMFRLPQIASYKRILFIDADVYITRHARNPFGVVGDLSWGMVDNNPYRLPYFNENDSKLYNHCPPENRPSIMLNAGVFVVTKEIAPLFEKVFYEYDEQPCYDNGPVSYHLLNGPKGVILPTEFNTIVVAYQMAYGRSLSALLTMYHESSFLHFAGGPTKSMPVLYLIKYIDTHPDSFFTKLIYFFGKKKYDFLTIPIMNGLRRMIVIYDYHVQKRFSLGDYSK